MKIIIKPYIFLLLAIVLSPSTYGQYRMYSSNSTEPVNNCFCFYPSEIANLLYNIDLAQTGAQLVLEHWLRDQESIMKDEIERRLNQDFSSYDAAQKEFFKKRYGDMEEPIWIEQWRDDVEEDQAGSRADMKEKYKRYQFFELRRLDLLRINNGQNPLYDYGDLKYGGRLIESLPYGEISNLASANKDHYDDWNELLTSDEYREDKLDKVDSEDKLAYYIADRFISHYNNHDQIDKVILMSGYLIADNSNVNPTSLSGGVTYYNYKAVNWYSPLTNLVNNMSGVNFPSVNTPSFSKAEIMGEYAITQMISYAKDFLLPKNNLKKEVSYYLDYNDFDQNSLDFSEDFFRRIATGGTYYPDWNVYDSNSVSYQTEDRPEFIFNMKIPSAGIQEGLYGFGNVLAELSAIKYRPEHEGNMMRNMMRANGYMVSNDITDEELGMVFDFIDTGNDYIKIGFSDDVKVTSYYDPDDNFGKSLFTDPFKIEAVKALAAGGEVDFYDEIIKDSTFIGTKADCAYEKLKSHNGNLFKETIGKFIDNPKYDLIFTVGDCTMSNIACTDGNKVKINGEITIIIEAIHDPILEVAASILHEGIHANIYRYVSSINSGVDPNDRPQILQYYQYYKGLAENSDYNILYPVTMAQHEYMAENYVKPIAEAIRSLDGNKYPLDYYMWYGWEGLESTYKFNDRLSSSDETKFNDYQETVNNNTNVKCN